MAARWIARLAYTVVALLMPAMLLGASAPLPGDAPPTGSLAGQLLIAAPTMGDPRFAQTVILMVRHDRSGALGIVINRPGEAMKLDRLLAAVGAPDATVEGELRVFAGGPVEPGVGLILHSAEYRRADTLDIDGRVAMSTSPEVLRDVGHRKGPAKILFALGYAGWGPGQLEGEMARRDGFTAPGDSRLIFDDDRDRLWDHAMARRGRDL
jgi:putative transcriptional regulator